MPLAHPTPELLAWAEARLPPAWLCEQAAVAWPGPRSLRLRLPGMLPRGPVRLCRLWWPWGAGRFALCHCLATTDQLALVRAYVYAGNACRPAPFVLDDGTRQVTTDLHLLPPLPLAQCGAPGDLGGLWLLPLVDARYFWWQLPASGVLPAGPSWADLFAAFGVALGVTLTADPADPAYLTPGDLLAGHDALPEALDAAADCAGMRVVRDTGGAVRVLGPRTALARQALNLALSPRVAGGELALTLGA